ncbi:prokaryotic E2 D family protein [Clostridioides difficile CD160]|uniref:PRTRC system protein B n=1 Tax=Clostridioides difficile TaxID=1496 RepID=A0A386JBR4_CLODI|nr:prokaryotic E2 D family protein [Clostridioides difficile]AYD68642.1 hypothetical protein pHSJD-312_00019 [Clostridioides difficile]EQF26844.1 prokaryotic E2 D family protein [Clostridioides difficile CD160]HBG7285349.1 hypothetical protein [Clostridioides difficile]
MKTILFELIENSNTVNLIENNNGRKRVKTLLVSDFISSILSSSELKNLSDIPFFSPIYQEKDNMKLIQTIQLNKTTKIYIILREELSAPMSFGKDFYSDIGMPNLLFAIKIVNNIFSKLYVSVSKTKNINENTQLFIYPFSNVYNNGNVCLGSNQINLDFNKIENIFLVPNIFFSMANTIDYFSVENNTQNLDYLELLEYLNHKQFDSNLLIKNYTYNEWTKKLIQNKL